MTSEDQPASTLHPSVPPGTSFGKYEVIRRLGEGGMGCVYEARHTELGRRVALKVLRSKLATNRTYLERFLREGRIAARLDHPHVVGVFDVGTEKGAPFLVMEFLSGDDLDTYLAGRPPLDTAQAVDLLLPILSALDAAHRAGLVHRDLKPANIFLSRAAHGGLHPKLLDFGIAKPGADEASNLTGTAEVFGTPHYMAPEQVRSAKDAKPESDQYAMGAILYRAVVGRDAFELGGLSVYAILERVVTGTFPSPRRARAEVDMGIERVILRAMAKDAADRFPSVRALGAALLPYASAGARKTWTDAFSTEAATAETLPPASPAQTGRGPRSLGTELDAGARSAATPTSERAPGTLSAAEVATHAALPRAAARASAASRPRTLGALGVALGLLACGLAYALATRAGGASQRPGEPVPVTRVAGSPEERLVGEPLIVASASAPPATSTEVARSPEPTTTAEPPPLPATIQPGGPARGAAGASPGTGRTPVAKASATPPTTPTAAALTPPSRPSGTYPIE